ncbi:MAG: ABC transporter permease [Bacilli bacterium]|nr:ABC transporter permease [Bacilli bacterium]
MNKRNFLIKESLKKKIRSKWFLGINIFVALLIIISVNIGSIINIFGGDFKDYKLLMVLDNVNVFDEFESNLYNNSSFDKDSLTINRTFNSIDTLKSNVRTNTNYILLVIDSDPNNIIKGTVYTKNGLSLINRNMILSSLNEIKYKKAISSLGLTSSDIKRINSSVELDSNILSLEKVDSVKDENNVLASIVVIVFILVFFFLIITLVQMIGSEINEEKTTKAMEIIISNVKATDHLIAKIVSCTLFTIIQLSLLFLYGFIASLLKDNAINNNSLISNLLNSIASTQIVNTAIQIIPILIIFFIFTLVSYAILAGVLASMTTSIDDFQQLQTPLMFLISIGFYLSILAMIFEGSILIKIISYIPMVSFLLAPTLFLLNQTSIISLIISLILQVIATFIIFKYGLRIYKEGILNYSTNHLWKKMFKALKNN